MTEGIIHKVHKRILEEYYDKATKGQLTDIFVRELIDEIRKAYDGENEYPIRIRIDTLIGDNQE